MQNNRLKGQNHLKKIKFTIAAINDWNLRPEAIISSNSVNTIKGKLEKS